MKESLVKIECIKSGLPPNKLLLIITYNHLVTLYSSSFSMLHNNAHFYIKGLNFEFAHFGGHACLVVKCQFVEKTGSQKDVSSSIVMVKYRQSWLLSNMTEKLLTEPFSRCYIHVTIILHVRGHCSL